MADEPQSPGHGTGGKPMSPTMVREMATFLGLGFLIGAVFTVFVGTILWSYGMITFGQVSCPEQKTTCPATPDLALGGIQVITATIAPTSTPTDTPTPDLLATATAACEAFSEQFPGTPCPPPEATVTPSP
jgi:hypothetical protein